MDVGLLAALVYTGQVECGMTMLGTGVSSLWVPTFPCSALGRLDAAIDICDLQLLGVLGIQD